jgi:cytochrome P450
VLRDEARRHGTGAAKQVEFVVGKWLGRDVEMAQRSIADIRVPARTLVWCVMRRDSVDDRYFQNAAAFEPAHWLGDAAAAKRIAMLFGSGPRI